MLKAGLHSLDFFFFPYLHDQFEYPLTENNKETKGLKRKIEVLLAIYSLFA